MAARSPAPGRRRRSPAEAEPQAGTEGSKPRAAPASRPPSSPGGAQRQRAGARATNGDEPGPTPTRLIVVTGKGGVGKTTTAAATAIACAAKGHRTLVVSTDPAHSLADALDEPAGPAPTSVGPRLDAMQIDSRRRLEEQWGDLRSYVAEVLAWAGVEQLAAEELTVLPGLEEVLALTTLTDLCASGRHDVVVVDCAPTAETLRLLSLPDVLGWWMRRLFPISRQLTGLVGPMVRQVTTVPVAGPAQFEALERLYDRLTAVRALLGENGHSTIRLVTSPEQVVVAETRRTATYLGLFGFAIDAVVVNRVLPDEVTDPWFDRWRAAQAAQLVMVQDSFGPAPVLVSPLAPEEPVGRARLKAFAGRLYGRRDPSRDLGAVSPFRVDRQGDDWQLALDLPFADRDEVGLVRRDAELIITVGTYRRALLLPDALIGRTVRKATVRDGRLTVTFAGR
jgi:arsenite-transporting ATPase